MLIIITTSICDAMLINNLQRGLNQLSKILNKVEAGALHWTKPVARSWIFWQTDTGQTLDGHWTDTRQTLDRHWTDTSQTGRAKGGKMVERRTLYLVEGDVDCGRTSEEVVGRFFWGGWWGGGAYFMMK